MRENAQLYTAGNKLQMFTKDDVSIKKMHKDNWLSVVIGPLKFIVPTLSYIILYPLMISKTSIEVVGVWSLIASTVSFMSVTDIGFSQLLTRDSGSDRLQHFNEVYADYVTAKRAYVLIPIILITIFIFTRKFIFTSVEEVYSTTSLTASIILITIGAFIQLSGKLDAAILSARHDNYIVQLITAIAPVLTYSVTIAGTLLKKPIEGLALGTVLSGAATVAAYKVRLSRNHNEFMRTNFALSLHATVKRFFFLIRRGSHLYSSSVGMMLRGPIYRYIIVYTIGLQAAAVFDIAMRVTQTVREVVASGFSVLFPTFCLLHRNGERARIIELIQISLMVLLTLGAFFLGLLMSAITQIFSLWLGNYPPELIPSTRVLAIWQLITLVNVPFWYLLQASQNERVAAYSIWSHTALILLIIPASLVLDISITDLLIYWTATSIITQGLIYYSIQSRLFILLEIIKPTKIILLFILVTTYSLINYLISYIQPETSNLIVSIILIMIIYILSAYTISYLPVIRFFRGKTTEI